MTPELCVLYTATGHTVQDLVVGTTSSGFRVQGV